MTKDTVNRRRILQDEFLVLSRTEARRLTRSTERATRHPAANRYSDIVPYDHTLVELDTGDYINASFVQGETDALRWIATQAPIDAGEMVGKETVSDFWQMIVQYDVACIVMLGQHQEDFVYHFVALLKSYVLLFDWGGNLDFEASYDNLNDTQKCGEYWPTSMGKTTRYGSVEVKIVCELEEKAWVHREFDVSPTPSYFSRSTKNSRKSRTSSVANHMKVSHWQYKEWKDSDTPRLSTFLEFLLQVRGRQYTSPVVVHCSAGIGRTGVFICTDNVISRLESEGIIDIFSEVNRSRQQRPSMVHTVKQYECIYNTIGEYLRQQQQQKK
ncbi:Protein CBG22148 [Caenorhabditis briggsae]|uniref:Protein CBG22148 n=1 Tax=Caenorhabditis briggsae TaxID=6238 RepID=A8Y1N1_CAEBR|nr:Protein CBG22148 [Caenorhabditis briggsae]CAP38801.1 Protein CBG22148 [Caenorhabditis briggsae]